MQPYLALLDTILREGEVRPNRTGVPTVALFGQQSVYDLEAGFPLVTTRQMSFKNVVGELLWMLSGSTNVKDLQQYGVNIWNQWADENGELGRVYGQQLRAWDHFLPSDEEYEPIDQIANLVTGLKHTPFSRRHIVNTWNVADLPDMRLPPCVYSLQFNVRLNNGEPRLDCLATQRSADAPVGVPHNIAVYALLSHMLAQVVGQVGGRPLQAGRLIFSYGDVHIYDDQIDLVRAQLKRQPRPLPQVRLNPDVATIDSFTPNHIKLDGYNPHPVIRYPVAV